jgi:cation diffusion facilitator family transporter
MAEGMKEPLISEETTTVDEWKLPLDYFVNKKKTREEIKKIKSKKQRHFYLKQNALIEQFEQISSGNITDKSDKYERRGLVAVRLSFALNLVLIAVKILVVIRTGSISLIASAVDSILDILSGLIIFITTCLMRKKNPYEYPAGKSRLEPLGIVIFSTCMFTAAFQIITESVQRIVDQVVTLTLDVWSFAALGFVIIVKIFLFIFCKVYGKGNESAQTLALDHRNDIISNSFSIGSVLIAYYYLWWFDPAGAICISLYIMLNWAIVGLRQVRILTGRSASKEFLQQLTFLCWNHHPEIKAIDTVRAYHLALGYLVEVDVILDPNMPLKEAHDIGESLQEKLEQFPNVERAFVHLDYEGQHKPEHRESRSILDTRNEKTETKSETETGPSVEQKNIKSSIKNYKLRHPKSKSDYFNNKTSESVDNTSDNNNNGNNVDNKKHNDDYNAEKNGKDKSVHDILNGDNLIIIGNDNSDCRKECSHKNKNNHTNAKGKDQQSLTSSTQSPPKERI